MSNTQRKPYSKSNKQNKDNHPSGKPRKEKPNSKDLKDAGKLDSTGRDNDPNWYFTDPKLAEQAAELSFQNMLGSGPVMSNYEVPTIMTFYMNPSPGITYQVTEKATSMPTDAQVQTASSSNLPATAVHDIKDGINLMSTKIYTLLSTYSGRTSNYGPQDIAIMTLALGSLDEYVEHIRRLFGLAMSYNPRNRMLPLGLLKALGVDGIDLINNLANYRMRFNVDISRINQIPIPDNIGFLKKCRALYEKVYVDEVSSMAQYYVYVPKSVWKLNETTVGSWTHGSWLETINIPTGATVGSLLTILEQMIDAMLFSSTYNIVYSDLINLANKTNVPFTGFDYLAENYVVVPEFNRNANLQMHNLTVFNAPTYASPNTGAALQSPWWDSITSAQGSPINNQMIFTPYNNVYADARTNSVVYNPVFPVMFTEMNTVNSGKAWFSGDNIVDMDIDSPTLEDRIEALRFKVIESGFYRSKYDSTTYTFAGFFKILPTLPDHYCTDAAIFTSYSAAATVVSNSVRDASASPFGESLITQLKNAPLMYCKSNQTYCDNTVKRIYGDMTFFTTIDYNYLMRLNRLISTGLFDFR